MYVLIDRSNGFSTFVYRKPAFPGPDIYFKLLTIFSLQHFAHIRQLPRLGPEIFRDQDLQYTTVLHERFDRNTVFFFLDS